MSRRLGRLRLAPANTRIQTTCKPHRCRLSTCSNNDHENDIRAQNTYEARQPISRKRVARSRSLWSGLEPFFGVSPADVGIYLFRFLVGTRKPRNARIVSDGCHRTALRANAAPILYAARATQAMSASSRAAWQNQLGTGFDVFVPQGPACLWGSDDGMLHRGVTSKITLREAVDRRPRCLDGATRAGSRVPSLLFRFSRPASIRRLAPLSGPLRLGSYCLSATLWRPQGRCWQVVRDEARDDGLSDVVVPFGCADGSSACGYSCASRTGSIGVSTPPRVHGWSSPDTLLCSTDGYGIQNVTLHTAPRLGRLLASDSASRCVERLSPLRTALLLGAPWLANALLYADAQAAGVSWPSRYTFGSVASYAAAVPVRDLRTISILR
ncbi:hypothetical protein GY45DRAFT_1317887, partial [Cubamyces sp. BRFM 1775]